MSRSFAPYAGPVSITSCSRRKHRPGTRAISVPSARAWASPNITSSPSPLQRRSTSGICLRLSAGMKVTWGPPIMILIAGDNFLANRAHSLICSIFSWYAVKPMASGCPVWMAFAKTPGVRGLSAKSPKICPANP